MTLAAMDRLPIADTSVILGPGIRQAVGAWTKLAWRP